MWRELIGWVGLGWVGLVFGLGGWVGWEEIAGHPSAIDVDWAHGYPWPR